VGGEEATADRGLRPAVARGHPASRSRGERSRSTDATVYCVSEGHGRSQVGDSTFAWGPHDIFVVPSWHPVSHQAEGEAVLFSFSDRAAQKALGLWREA